MIEIQQAAEPLAAPHSAVLIRRFRRSHEQYIPQALVVPFAMVVLSQNLIEASDLRGQAIPDRAFRGRGRRHRARRSRLPGPVLPRPLRLPPGPTPTRLDPVPLIRHDPGVLELMVRCRGVARGCLQRPTTTWLIGPIVPGIGDARRARSAQRLERGRRSGSSAKIIFLRDIPSRSPSS